MPSLERVKERVNMYLNQKSTQLIIVIINYPLKLTVQRQIKTQTNTHTHKKKKKFKLTANIEL